MPILLSEEEILDKQFYYDKFTEPAILEGSKKVAKAQLKKVVEEYQKQCFLVIQNVPILDQTKVEGFMDQLKQEAGLT